MDLTALDWIMLRREDVKRVLDARGLTNARVVGWAGAGKELPGPAEIEVDLPQVTDLTSGDLARLGRELTTLVGVEIVVWAAVPGDGTAPTRHLGVTDVKQGQPQSARPRTLGRFKFLSTHG